MSKAKIAAGAAVAAVAGFVSGILLAPKSGKETREDIKKAAVTTKDGALENAGKAKDAAEKKAREAKVWGEEVVGDVSDKANDFKTRTERAVEAAKKGFNENPNAKKK
jgi:Gas vesicle protein